MKIEMGESLFYSWLRHIKGCQLVQTNWKVSHRWPLYHEGELEEIKNKTDSFFREKYGYEIYKRNASLKQILQQGECDVLGICFQGRNSKVYAVDVAFHKGGLNYGESRQDTVMKVVSKCLRTAMCIHGYFDNREAEIIFASPKINPLLIGDVAACVSDAQKIMDSLGYNFKFMLISNEEFKAEVLYKVLNISNDVADTAELFLRSYQMLQMFDSSFEAETEAETEAEVYEEEAAVQVQNEAMDEAVRTEEADRFSGMKVGEIARNILRPMLERGCASEEEILKMQTDEYSKEVFGLYYPLLVKAEVECEKRRYYSTRDFPFLKIRGKNYRLCNHWREQPSGSLLIRWINRHTDNERID
ncbi:MAG: hypothetical protein LUC97_04495 [Clostridiales bacterium]|nr:hypothetical protein [Clostridiales bacterium]